MIKKEINEVMIATIELVIKIVDEPEKIDQTRRKVLELMETLNKLKIHQCSYMKQKDTHYETKEMV